MDIFQTAKYFDSQSFDVWDFGTSSWLPEAIKGQLKKTDTFTEIWNRPTRKRLLTTAPGQEPNSPVVRVTDTGETFMVGASHKDAWDGYYRFIAGLHLVAGTAEIHRRAPVGPANDPGWAVDQVVMTTFGDAELRSASENEEIQIEHYGSYFLFLPINTPLLRDDSVSINGRTYFVLEWYVDSGLICGRSTVEPDARVNVVYVSLGAETYDNATQTSSTPRNEYNVTGRFLPAKQEEGKDENVINNQIEFKILKSWIGVTPKVNDEIKFGGKTYRVIDISQNALQDEWYIQAQI